MSFLLKFMEQYPPTLDELQCDKVSLYLVASVLTRHRWILVYTDRSQVYITLPSIHNWQLTSLHTDYTTHWHHYIQTTLHTHITTHWHHYTQTTLHTDITTHRQHYTLTSLHTDNTTYWHHYTQTTLHTHITTHWLHNTLTSLHTEHYILISLHTDITIHRQHYILTSLHTDITTLQILLYQPDNTEKIANPFWATDCSLQRILVNTSGVLCIMNDSQRWL